MRRLLAVVAVAVLVVGGAATAFAASNGGGGDGGGAARRAETKLCRDKARADHVGDRAAIRAAARECLTAAGIDPAARAHARRARRGAIKGLTPDERAALKECVKSARSTHTDDRTGRREAVKACLAQAGITPPTPAP